MNVMQKMQKLRDEYQRLCDSAKRESQSLMVLTDLHSKKREKMLTVGRELGVYRKVRVYESAVKLLNRHLSPHKRVHISMEEVLGALGNLAHRDDTVSIIGPLDRFIVSEEGDASLYREVYEEVKEEYESLLLQ